jgi:hypothetical protein
MTSDQAFPQFLEIESDNEFRKKKRKCNCNTTQNTQKRIERTIEETAAGCRRLQNVTSSASETGH